MSRLSSKWCREATFIYLHFLMQCTHLSNAKYIGANPDQVNRPELKCQVEGRNYTPGEELTFRCVVTPVTVIRYCEMRPPWGASPILVEDGSNQLIGTDLVDDLIWIDPSSTTTPPSTTTPWMPKPKTPRTTTAATTTSTSSTTSSEIASSSTTSASTTSSSTTSPPTMSSSTTDPLTTKGENRTRRSERVKFYGWSSRLDYVGRGFSSGDCSTAIRKVSLEDAGTWKVTVGIEEQMTELAVKIEVALHEATTLPLKTNIEVPEDWAWAILTCHTTDHKPLRFCRFLRADSSPLIPEDSEVGPGLNLEAGVGHGRFMYHGNGMSTGDCGVTLTTLVESDAGNWLCVVGVSGEAGQQKGELTLRPPPSSAPGGLSLGAMMGIGLVCAFVLFVVVHEIIERRVTWREKRAARKRSEKAARDSQGAHQNGGPAGKL